MTRVRKPVTAFWLPSLRGRPVTGTEDVAKAEEG